jgi:hypothetical protein
MLQGIICRRISNMITYLRHGTNTPLQQNKSHDHLSKTWYKLSPVGDTNIPVYGSIKM